MQYFIHGPGGQLLAEYRETPNGPELVREYIYLGSKLIASSTRVDPPVPTGRVTGVTASPQAQKYGLQTTITVTGWTTPCSKVQVNFGDGTGDQQYTVASPYQLPLQVTHTYAAAGLYKVVATGQTGASGPCVGTVSAPVEVTSGNVVTNGTFAQVDGNGNPVNWSIFTSAIRRTGRCPSRRAAASSSIGTGRRSRRWCCSTRGCRWGRRARRSS